MESIYSDGFKRIHRGLLRVDGIKQRVQVTFEEKGGTVKVATGMVLPAIASPPVKITFNQPFHFRITKKLGVIMEGFYNGGDMS